MCLPIIAAENWKPATKTEQVIQSLVGLVNDPEPEHPLRADLAGNRIFTLKGLHKLKGSKVQRICRLTSIRN